MLRYMCNVSFVQYLIQSINPNNPSMDSFSSLVPDGKRYTDMICMIVFSRARRFVWGTSWLTLLHRLDFKVSSNDRIPLAQPRFPRIYFDYICYDTLHNYLKTAAKSSQVPIFILLLCMTAINPLNPELNPICYLLALLAHHFLHVSRIRVKSLTLKLLMSYIYGAPILDVSRSHTTTHHSR